MEERETETRFSLFIFFIYFFFHIHRFCDTPGGFKIPNKKSCLSRVLLKAAIAVTFSGSRLVKNHQSAFIYYLFL